MFRRLRTYTTLYALRSLAEQSPFRLSNGAYMNDPEEGETFLEIMRDDHKISVKDCFYKKNLSYPSPAYIGSFTKVTPGGAEPKDKLFLWRTYGKQDTEEAAGACLIFEYNGAKFCRGTPTKNWLYASTHNGRHVSTEIQNPRFTGWFYRNDKGDMSEELSQELSQLSEALKQIEAHVLREVNDKGEQLRGFACELLDSIRFLFKKDHYKEEQEVPHY